MSELTEQEKREQRMSAYTNIAVCGLALIGTWIAAPIFDSGGFASGNSWILPAGNGLNDMPWFKIAGIGALLPLGWEMTNRVPRQVKAPDIVPGSWKVPLGLTRRNKWVYWDVKNDYHMKIGGITGGGKSEFLKLLLYVLCQQKGPDKLQVQIIDLKEGATLSPFVRLPHVRGVHRTTAQALLALTEAQDIMRNRLEIIRQCRESFQPVPDFPFYMVVLDEGGELCPAEAEDTPSVPEKSMRQECMHILSTLVRRGREARLRIIYATQRPDRYTLPMQIRSQLETTICFRVREHYDSEIVLGHKGAEKIRNIPGRMIYQTPNGEMPVQTAYIPQSAIEQWLSEYEWNGPVFTTLVDEEETDGGIVSTSSDGDSIDIWRM